MKGLDPSSASKPRFRRAASIKPISASQESTQTFRYMVGTCLNSRLLFTTQASSLRTLRRRRSLARLVTANRTPAFDALCWPFPGCGITLDHVQTGHVPEAPAPSTATGTVVDITHVNVNTPVAVADPVFFLQGRTLGLSSSIWCIYIMFKYARRPVFCQVVCVISFTMVVKAAGFGHVVKAE